MAFQTCETEVLGVSRPQIGILCVSCVTSDGCVGELARCIVLADELAIVGVAFARYMDVGI